MLHLAIAQPFLTSGGKHFQKMGGDDFSGKKIPLQKSFKITRRSTTGSGGRSSQGALGRPSPGTLARPSLGSRPSLVSSVSRTSSLTSLGARPPNTNCKIF